MMRFHFARLTILILVLCTPVLGGCSLARQQPQTRLYVLTALPPVERAPQAGATHSDTIGVGPVALPQYANRPQIVTGNSGQELRRAPFDNWAEPLEDNFARVLAANLSILLATDQVAVFPWKGPMPIGYQVVVEVTQFLGEPGGQVLLEAVWSIVGKNGKDVLVRKKSSFSEPVGAQGYGALAAAMSRVVAALSRDIATTITTLSPTVANG